MVFHRLVPESRGPRMLAAVATAALALSACVSGGGGGGGGAGSGSSSGLAPSSSASAGGVRAVISWTGSPAIGVFKGADPWTHNPGTVQPAPSGWTAVTKQDAAGNAATELFRVVTNLDASEEDYLAYGYWSRLPLDSLDDFKPFYYGHTPYTGNVVEQTGTATYTGGATGVYQTDTSSGSTAVAGRFTANVSINVSFGNNTESAGLRFGMSNIETLTSAGAAGPGLNSIPATAVTADATGSSFTGKGNTGAARWGGRFFGPSGGKPTGIAGWFRKLHTTNSANNASVLLSGVFGATR